MFGSTEDALSAAEEKEEKRMLGLVLLRGESVVSLQVQGPAPSHVSTFVFIIWSVACAFGFLRNLQEKKVGGGPSGPGIGRAAGRGASLCCCPPLTGFFLAMLACATS